MTLTHALRRMFNGMQHASSAARRDTARAVARARQLATETGLAASKSLSAGTKRIGQGLPWYGREMAGLKPDESFSSRPVRSLWNTLSTPVWDPWLRSVAPRTSRVLGYGAKGVAGGSLLAGVAGSPFTLRDTATNDYAAGLGRLGYPPEAKDDLSGRFRRRFFSHMAIPSITDQTLVGRAYRGGLLDQAAPIVRRSLWETTRNGPNFGGKASPYIGKVIDLARSSTPLGAIMTAGMYGLRRPDEPDVYGAALRRFADEAKAMPAGQLADELSESQLAHALSLTARDVVRHPRTPLTVKALTGRAHHVATGRDGPDGQGGAVLLPGIVQRLMSKDPAR